MGRSRAAPRRLRRSSPLTGGHRELPCFMEEALHRGRSGHAPRASDGASCHQLSAPLSASQGQMGLCSPAQAARTPLTRAGAPPSGGRALPLTWPCAPPQAAMCSPSRGREIPSRGHVLPLRLPCAPPHVAMCSPSRGHVLPLTWPCAPPQVAMCSPSRGHVLPLTWSCAPPHVAMCSPS